MSDQLLSDDPALCSACSGTGEGPYDGSTCALCLGRGVAVEDLEDRRLARDEDRAEARGA